MKSLFLIFFYLIANLLEAKPPYSLDAVASTIAFGFSNAAHWDMTEPKIFDALHASVKPSSEGNFIVSGDLWRSNIASDEDAYCNNAEKAFPIYKFFYCPDGDCFKKMTPEITIQGNADFFWIESIGVMGNSPKFWLKDMRRIQKNFKLTLNSKWMNTLPGTEEVKGRDISDLMGVVFAFAQKKCGGSCGEENTFYLGPVSRWSSFAYVYWKNADVVIPVELQCWCHVIGIERNFSDAMVVYTLVGRMEEMTVAGGRSLSSICQKEGKLFKRRLDMTVGTAPK